jgi:hypothetical protein
VDEIQAERAERMERGEGWCEDERYDRPKSKREKEMRDPRERKRMVFVLNSIM